MPTGTANSTSAPLAPLRLLPSPLAARFGFEMLAIAKINEGIKGGFRHDINIAAAPAISAIGAAKFDEFLTSKGDAARAAMTTRYMYFGLI